MNYLSLFSGIGGFDLGLDRAGMTCVGQVEIDPFCQRVLAKHWPEVPRHDNVRTAIDWWLGATRPCVDLVAGGYPCQGESDAGRRRGTDDERWLWPEMARVIHALRPRYVIGENVLGHRTRGLRFVLRDLERLGYTARAGVIAAREVGAPHLRRRIITIAERAGLADTDHQAGRPETRNAVAGTGGAKVGERPAESGGRRSDVADTISIAGQARWTGDAGQGAHARHVDRSGLGSDVADTSGQGLEGPWWAAEPDVGRVAHGVPARVDRLRSLGNAIVPQVAERIGRLIIEHADQAVTR